MIAIKAVYAAGLSLDINGQAVPKQGLEDIDYELFDLLGSPAASALFSTAPYERYAEPLP